MDTPMHGATLQTGKEGVFFGANSLNMQNAKGEIEESYSIAAGLDFPSVGPQHAYLQSIGRAQYVGVTDAEALEAFMLLSLKEGIIPALESSHALAYALKLMNENPVPVSSYSLYGSTVSFNPPVSRTIGIVPYLRLIN